MSRNLKLYGSLSAVPVAVAALYFLLGAKKEYADIAVRLFSRPARDALGTVSGLVPFSVMEVIYLAGGVFLLVFVIRTLVLLFKEGFGRFLRRLTALALIAAYLLAAYLALWGIDYKGSGFSDREDFHTAGVTEEALYETTAYFVRQAMLYADSVSRDAEGRFHEDIPAVLESCGTLYDELERRFPSLTAVSRTPKRMTLFSELMSATGFTGIYFPFTGESNVNVAQPAAFIPSTAAHELAHQRGVFSEQECNFLGVTAGVTSQIPAYRYSGYLAGSLYLMNALWSASPEKWRELRATFEGGYLTDWTENSDYWRAFQENETTAKVTSVSEKVYDTYLKVQGQELGIRSYGACVDMLVAYYLAGGYD